jgi:hypothetical protein
MTNNNHKNSGCGFSEQLVSYLYGESGAAEKSAFETHLRSCSACAEELEAFSGVHFSITDWKTKEFASLAPPVIEIPYKISGQKLSRTEIVSDVNGSWWSGLRNLLSLSPNWSLATASMAVLAVCVGIGLIALNSGKSNDIAGGANKDTKPSAVPTIEKNPDQSNTNATKNIAPEKAVKPPDEPKSPQSEVAVAPDRKNRRVVKDADSQRPTQRTEASNSPKNKDVKPNNKNNKPAEPKIIEDEEEDDTLRLAELFEEIDTKE